MAWPASVVRLDWFGDLFEQRLTMPIGRLLLQELIFGGIFIHALGGGTWPSTLNWIMVPDDSEPSAVAIT